MQLFKRHVHLCAHKMELHAHIQAVRASQKHVLVSVQTVTLFAETLIINMRVTDDGEALLPSDMRMFLKNTELSFWHSTLPTSHAFMSLLEEKFTPKKKKRKFCMTFYGSCFPPQK